MEVIVARAPGLDVHKDTVTECVRAPDPAEGGAKRCASSGRSRTTSGGCCARGSSIKQ